MTLGKQTPQHVPVQGRAGTRPGNTHVLVRVQGMLVPGLVLVVNEDPVPIASRILLMR